MAARRILIVANQTAPGAHVKSVVSQRIAEGPCTFMLLVPAAAPPGHWTWTEAEAAALAHRRMNDALVGLRELGADIEGSVHDGSPMDAVATFMQIERFENHVPFDEIILSTLPPGASRWLRQDLPHRLQRRYGISVTHIISEPIPVPVG